MEILCRICGGTQNLKFFQDNKRLVELLEVCANIIIKENDLLPKFICKQCENGLLFSYRLRKKSEETEKRLRHEIEAQTISTTTDIEDELSVYNIQQQVPSAGQIRDQRLISDVDSNICTSTNQSEKTCQSDGVEQSLELISSNTNDSNAKDVEEGTSSNKKSNENVMEILDLENMPELTDEERLQLELRKRGVFMVKRLLPDSSDSLTKDTKDHEVIAEKRIQLDVVSQIKPEVDNEGCEKLQQNDISEAFEYGASNEDGIIELLDDDEQEQENFQQGKSQFEALQTYKNEDDHTIEDILSADADEESQYRSLKEQTDIVYEESDNECNELIDIDECQMYFTKVEHNTFDDVENTETLCTTTLEKIDVECTTVISSKTITEETIANYICGVCNLGFTNKYNYHDHVKKHDGKSFECKICNKTFLRRDSLKRHTNAHNNKDDLQCTHCDRNFQSRFNLTRHVRAVHKSVCVMCDVCGQVFTRSDVLHQHMAKHNSEFDVQCDQCPKRFITLASMKKHLSYHSKESTEKNCTGDKNESTKKVYYCVHCGKESNSHFTHKMHLRTHTLEKPHKCETCGKAFRTLAALTAHDRIHTDVRPYQCEHCLLSFRQQGHLKEHRMIHEGITPHVCSICQLAFTKKGNMLAHMRIHSGEFPYKCVLCGEQFRRSEQLRKHEYKVHKNSANDDVKKISETSEISNEGEELKTEKNIESDNLTNELLCSDSDSIEIIETGNFPDAFTVAGNIISDDIDNQPDCYEVTADDNREVAIESSVTNNTNDDFAGIDSAVVLVVDDNATFNSLFIMDN